MFLYYYFDVGNTQAAHGRAPAVALGHKLANPDTIVVSYQGDGDLASIGLAEIVHAAQLGIPITVIFVNNAVYGMTGGQIAPTTLMGQKTTTTPARAATPCMGQPLKMAELIAQLDGAGLRGAGARSSTRSSATRAAKAIKKALAAPGGEPGLLLRRGARRVPDAPAASTPEEAERWVKEQMVPVFPLGVKKDVAASGELGRVRRAHLRSRRRCSTRSARRASRAPALRVRVPRTPFGGDDSASSSPARAATARRPRPC